MSFVDLGKWQMMGSVKKSSIQGIDIMDLVSKYGTPLYLFDSEIMVDSYQQLNNFSGEHVDIFYSLKANPNKSIVDYLNQLGAGLEVCSLAELNIALSCDVQSDSILLVGPYKCDTSIAESLKANIYAIVFESFNELDRIIAEAKRQKVVARVMARLNPDFCAKDALLKMGGQPSQFGIDIDQFETRIENYLENPYLDLVGIHIYNGTRILNSETIVDNTHNILKTAERIQERYRIKFECVDIGGGVGVPYFEGERAINLDENQAAFQQIIQAYLIKYPNTKIIMESGRYLVADSGVFVSQIRDIKISKGKNYLITDGGTNCHMAAVGVGSLVKKNFPISWISNNNVSEELISYNITGPLCTPNDLLAKEVLLSHCEIGDLICVGNSGAYGATASPVYFLSHGYPAEVMVHKQKDYLIRKRDYVLDIDRKQINLFQQKENCDAK